MAKKPHKGLIDAVAYYLMLEALARTKREQINAIYERLLTSEFTLFTDRAKRVNQEPKRINCYLETYLTEDEDGLLRLYRRVHEVAVAEGVKPVEMKEFICPALVAEHNQRKAAITVIDEVGIMLGEGEKFSKCVPYAKFQETLRMTVQLVLAHSTEEGK